jgi:hypothetical protein
LKKQIIVTGKHGEIQDHKTTGNIPRRAAQTTHNSGFPPTKQFTFESRIQNKTTKQKIYKKNAWIVCV